MPTSVKDMLSSANASVPKITAGEARRLIDDEGALLIAVRDAPELEQTVSGYSLPDPGLDNQNRTLRSSPQWVESGHGKPTREHYKKLKFIYFAPLGARPLVMNLCFSDDTPAACVRIENCRVRMTFALTHSCLATFQVRHLSRWERPSSSSSIS